MSISKTKGDQTNYMEFILIFNDGSEGIIKDDERSFKEFVESIKNEEWIEGDNFAIRTSSIERVFEIKNELKRCVKL
jgi:hypothetical protein